MRYLVNGIEAELELNAGVEILNSNDRIYVRTLEGTNSALVTKIRDKVLISYLGRTFEIEKQSAKRSKAKVQANGEIRAPMPGQIVEVFVEQDQQVVSGQKLIVLEAMKMQLTLSSPAAGKVDKVLAQKGQQITAAQLLIHIEIQHEPTGDAI